MSQFDPGCVVTVERLHDSFSETLERCYAIPTVHLAGTSKYSISGRYPLKREFKKEVFIRAGDSLLKNAFTMEIVRKWCGYISNMTKHRGVCFYQTPLTAELLKSDSDGSVYRIYFKYALSCDKGKGGIHEIENSAYHVLETMLKEYETTEEAATRLYNQTGGAVAHETRSTTV